ncbi:MAG: type II 3-dehydroquinate dehydratase [candidate division Zixibacteria bacterium]|nr:type II 3-dehydroquinate dehydratase [candidate division Zixibacteria bacterium]
MKKIVVIHGPNLNLLGEREPEVYGHTTLSEINHEIETFAGKFGFTVSCHQSNSEGEIIDLLQANRTDIAGIIINAGGFSHTSVAILDALLAAEVPVVEVHLSNLSRREEFRQRSITARGAVGLISGLGWRGYLLAAQYLIDSFQD